ncbi:hypothetical protein EDB92DRAFT_1816260 [Lactarius akahatsu]|uniref:Uncharacterized protein n=1 Tax=Lactarius akahatsu TaxID=416441 RepID=A0AAD4LHC2_9AGAM|nr:hypothetical protein EDB92DRAFT_1816260 [Lactarius akahatsu]
MHDPSASLRQFSAAIFKYSTGKTNKDAEGVPEKYLQNRKGGTPQTRELPTYLYPLHKSFFGTAQQADNLTPTSEQSRDQKMQTLKYDGPLVNLILLAIAVLLRDDVGHSKLSFCWKTLDLLLKGLRIARTSVSHSALTRFDHVHSETRTRVQTGGQSSRLTPLLECLDAVARGRRLSLVFSRYPKYHGRVDVALGKAHFRNPNLLQEFASCLPDFISLTDHDESTRSWRTLSARTAYGPVCKTISVTPWEKIPRSQRSRGFLWLAARALLAQFSTEEKRNGTVVFRSQWDVASLARLFYTLGVGGEEDAEFWSPFIDGGHVDAGFMTKAQDTLTKAVQGGPLLNFCKLGRLATTMVPFDGSDLSDLDLENLLELLQSMTEDSRLPLKDASPEVWEDLSRLRDIISKSRDRDKVKLQPLFEKIEQVYELDPFASQESGLGDRSGAPDSEISTFVQPRLSSRELRPSHNRSSDASGSSSTVTADGRYEAPLINENDGEFAINARPDPPSAAPAYPSHSRNEYATYYSASDPYHAFPSPMISPFNPSFPYIRHNIRHYVVPPAADIYPIRSPSTSLTPRSPRPGSPEPASAETASPSGHTGAFVVPEIYEISESSNPTYNG